MDKKEQIQDLISQGKTEEALEVLEQLTTDAVLLQSRFNGAKKQYGMGMIDFNEWSRTQAQINYAALEMMRGVKGGKKSDSPADISISNSSNVIAGVRDLHVGGDLIIGGNTPAGEGNDAGSAVSQKQRPKVYITYSPEAKKDKEAALKMKAFLVSKSVNVITNDDMELGADIPVFVNDSIRQADLILAVISKQSLRSSWESGEAALDIVLERVSENRVVPVSLDKSVLDPDFYFESIDFLNKKINEYQGYIQKAISGGGDSRAFQSDLTRLQNSKNQLAQIIEKMKSVRMVSMGRSKDSSDRDFEDGMNKILNRVNNSKT